MSIIWIVILAAALAAIIAGFVEYPFTRHGRKGRKDGAEQPAGGRKILVNGFTPFMIGGYPLAAELDIMDAVPDGVESFVAKPDVARDLGVAQGRFNGKLAPGDEVYVAAWDNRRRRYVFMLYRLLHYEGGR